MTKYLEKYVPVPNEGLDFEASRSYNGLKMQGVLIYKRNQGSC